MGKIRTYLSQNLRRPITNRMIKTKMTPEAKSFLDNFSRTLDNVLNSCDTLFKQYKDKPMREFLIEVSPRITKISVEQTQNLMYLPFHSMLYLITKKLKPDLALETGVQIGGSTHCILRAMHENNYGKLYSVDIGKFWTHDHKYVASIAPLVTEHEKPYWNFILGNSQKTLPNLVKKIGQMDLFCAGHTHTYEVQENEGELCWSFIKRGGVFVLDRPDWNQNKYLNEFLERYGDEVAFHQTYKEAKASDTLEFTVILKK